MGKKNILWVLILMVFVFSSFASASVVYKPDTSINLYQVCDSCTYVNIESVIYPSGEVVYLNDTMNKNGYSYTYNWSNTSELGEYFYFVCGDKDEVLTCETLSFYVSKTGFDYDTTFKVIITYIIGLAIILGILLYIAFKLDEKHIVIKFFIVAFSIFMASTITRAGYILYSNDINIDLVKYYTRFIKVFVYYVFAYFVWELAEYYGKTSGLKRWLKDKFGRG